MNYIDDQDALNYSRPELEVPKSNDFEDIVSKVREVALIAMQKFSTNPLSEQYLFFKKIWEECDRATNKKDENHQ